MMYTEAQWNEVRQALPATAAPSQAMQNLLLFLTHSRVWIEQLQLTRTLDAERGIVGIREDPIDIEKLMERRVLALWNKLTPQNADSIQSQLEALPLEITPDRLRGMCERFVTTLQINHAYSGVYVRVLAQIEKHGAWKDAEGRRMSEVLLPLLLEKRLAYRGDGAMAAWIDRTAGSASTMGDEERFEWEQKWKRNYQSLLKAIVYGAIHKLWSEAPWLSVQEDTLAPGAADTDLEAWMQVYQAWRKDGAQGGGRWWRGAKARLTERLAQMGPGRMRFLLEDVLKLL